MDKTMDMNTGMTAVKTVSCQKDGRLWQGLCERDPEEGCWYGEVSGIEDVVTFAGQTDEELARALSDSLDEYFAVCEEIGKTPQLPA